MVPVPGSGHDSNGDDFGRDCRTSPAGPHWSDLDGCDALHTDLDNERSVAIGAEDLAFTSDSEYCNVDDTE